MRSDRRGPRFDRVVPDDGYQWHYLDAVSADGELAIVVIALLGNPFSPRYAAARRVGPTNPLTYSSINVALYGRRASAWALQEFPVGPHDRSETGMAIGRSAIHWDGDRLVVDVDEVTTPLGPALLRRPLHGQIVLEPEAYTGATAIIDPAGRHTWWPVAPRARVHVDLPSHEVRFSGHGYHDANAGTSPLERDFTTWSWSRARLKTSAYISYDVECVDGSFRSQSYAIDARGELEAVTDGWRVGLRRSAWGLRRSMPTDPRATPRVRRSLEDGPFYARALVDTTLRGERVLAMHETLAAHRLKLRIVQGMAGYRIRPG